MITTFDFVKKVSLLTLLDHSFMFQPQSRETLVYKYGGLTYLPL
jgi:hypothetical protein